MKLQFSDIGKKVAQNGVLKEKLNKQYELVVVPAVNLDELYETGGEERSDRTQLSY